MEEFLKDFKKGLGLHHGFLLVGEIEPILKKLSIAVEDLVGVRLDSYPDYFFLRSPLFTVDNSRLLREKQQLKSFGLGPRIFIIVGSVFTIEAQNALLKTLEEPLFEDHFFIVTEKEDNILPTLRSRLLTIASDLPGDNDLENICNDFVAADLVSRFIMMEKFLKDTEGPISYEGADKKDKEKFLIFLNQLEKKFVLSLGDKTKEIKGSSCRFLEELLIAKRYLSRPSAVLRLIIEYLAIICPREY